MTFLLTAFFLLALVGAGVLAQAWLLILAAGVFADIQLPWRRSVLALVVGAVASSATGRAVESLLVDLDGGPSAVELVATPVLAGLAWAVCIWWITGMDAKATLLTTLGLVAVTTAFEYAIGFGAVLGVFA